jgi:hypothetical protein
MNELQFRKYKDSDVLVVSIRLHTESLNHFKAADPYFWIAFSLKGF